MFPVLPEWLKLLCTAAHTAVSLLLEPGQVGTHAGPVIMRTGQLSRSLQWCRTASTRRQAIYCGSLNEPQHAQKLGLGHTHCHNLQPIRPPMTISGASPRSCEKAVRFSARPRVTVTSVSTRRFKSCVFSSKTADPMDNESYCKLCDSTRQLVK
jgi:hypothetical protein